MDWQRLLTTKRLGQETNYRATGEVRSEFERDYDRLIFSAPFRRLQNKTQVFPLPGNIFVHNRLTHSLEVSSVGRSLGSVVAKKLRERYPDSPAHFEEIGSIVSAACLAHDLGNPPFGHSGEHAIATFFSEGKGQSLRSLFTDEQWADFTHFDGNANAFRLLAHQFQGRRDGGFCLTYSTLASIIKYPYPSINCPPNKQKFGYFLQDKPLYDRIVSELGLTYRHPLVYLVEAADDICYEMMDIEDACKLHILSIDEARERFLAFFPEEKRESKRQYLHEKVSDNNEQLAYLRSIVIGLLVNLCADVFVDSEQAMLTGDKLPSLMNRIPEEVRQAYQACEKLSLDRIYRSPIVLDIELGGYKVIMSLLETYVEAALHPENAYSKQLFNRVPAQYNVSADDLYVRILSVLDYLSGMTDVYAVELYQKITGIHIPSI